jgi:hypothetical protein
MLMFVGAIVLMITERDDLEAQEPSPEMSRQREENRKCDGGEEEKFGGMNKSGWRIVKGKYGLSYGTTENAARVAQVVHLS